MTRIGLAYAVLAASAGLISACSSQDKAPASLKCNGLANDTMVWIPGGTFTIGENSRYSEEGPPRQVAVQGFWMDIHEVTNRQFAAFVKATGYKTMAERAPPAMPEAPPELRQPGSAVFTVPSDGDARWWRWVVGANWRQPEGPQTVPASDGENLPVVQIAIEDAQAYARWAGKELPSEEQWEFAARTGGARTDEPIDEDGKPTANFYQGAFPARNTGADGFIGRAPVGCFKANDHGLFDMIGNVWEWTRDTAPEHQDRFVVKGGSYLCAANYCARYRPAARQFQERGLGTDHIGLRLIDTNRSPPAKP